MDDIVVVQIVHGFKYLLDCSRGILFRELAVFANSVKELPTDGQLGDNVIFVLSHGLQL